MRSSENTTTGESLLLQTLQEVLQEHPVQLAILFGSHATGVSHSRSDIDIAVDFDTVRPSDPAYNKVFLGLSVDLSEALETDDVDLVDLQTTSPVLAETIFDHGVLLIGDREHVAEIRRQLTATEKQTQSLRERFDAAVARIDRHLSGSTVTATDGETRDR